MLQHATGVIFLHQMGNDFQNVCVLGFHFALLRPLSSKSSFWQIKRAIVRPGLCQVASPKSPLVSGTEITLQIHFSLSNPSVTAEIGGMAKKKKKLKKKTKNKRVAIGSMEYRLNFQWKMWLNKGGCLDARCSEGLQVI